MAARETPNLTPMSGSSGGSDGGPAPRRHVGRGLPVARGRSPSRSARSRARDRTRSSCACTPAASAAPTSTSCATAGASSPGLSPATNGAAPSPRSATTSTEWSVGEFVVGGASPKCGTCRRCREGKPSQCENRQSMTGEHTRRRLRRVHRRAGGGCAAAARGSLTTPRRPRRTAVGGAARHHPLGRRARRHRHGLRGRPDRRAQRRGAAVDGRSPTSPWSSPTRAGAAWPPTSASPAVVDPADLEVFASWEPERMSSRAVHVVLECSGHRAAIEAGFNQLGAWRHLGHGRRRHRPPHLRHQPHDPQRADRHRLLRLRPRTASNGRSSCSPPTASPPISSSIPTTSRSTASAMRSRISPLGRIAGKVMVVPEVRS